jgi:hypothetical protein
MPESPGQGDNATSEFVNCLPAASKKDDLKFGVNGSLAAITSKIKTGTRRLSAAEQLADTMALPAGIEPAFAT